MHAGPSAASAPAACWAPSPPTNNIGGGACSHLPFLLRSIRLDNREASSIGWMRQLIGGIGTHADRTIARKQVSFLIEHGLEGASIDRGVSERDAALRFFELEALHCHSIKFVAFNFFPEGFFQDRQSVEPRLLEHREELRFGQGADDALAPELLVDLQPRRNLAV